MVARAGQALALLALISLCSATDGVASWKGDVYTSATALWTSAMQSLSSSGQDVVFMYAAELDCLKREGGRPKALSDPLNSSSTGTAFKAALSPFLEATVLLLFCKKSD